ncbi:PPE family protein [Mycobacterium sherrisii]|nr:PPE family protein [Mycobacterium sherrisii]MEC4761788.1 PPE family protein [Mycobacterium sherrisii]
MRSATYRKTTSEAGMDFGALPPEVNSGRMYSGPGPGTLLSASAGWEELAVEMHMAAGRCEAVIAELISESWTGPSSMAMTAAILPYTAWVRDTATQCEEVATKATAAAYAYETAFAMTVPPPLIAANRARLAALVASNLIGQNTPAIMATEAEYADMWAVDAAAMYGYAANAVAASGLSAFTAPPRTAEASGPESSAQGVSAKLLQSAATTLQGMSGPGSGASTTLSTTGPLASSGLSGLSGLSPLAMLSRVAKTSGKAVPTTTNAGIQSASQLALAMHSLVDVSSGSAPEIGTSALGFGSDGFGLSTDISGFALDLAGSGLELVGSDSLLGVEEALPELGAVGPLGALDQLVDPWAAGLGGDPAAGLGQASHLGTLSVPPGWLNAASGPSASHAAGPDGHHSAPGAPHKHHAKLPPGGMVTHASGSAAHRVGVPTTLMPRSPIGG